MKRTCTIAVLLSCLATLAACDPWGGGPGRPEVDEQVAALEEIIADKQQRVTELERALVERAAEGAITEEQLQTARTMLEQLRTMQTQAETELAEVKQQLADFDAASAQDDETRSTAEQIGALVGTPAGLGGVFTLAAGAIFGTRRAIRWRRALGGIVRGLDRVKASDPEFAKLLDKAGEVMRAELHGAGTGVATYVDAIRKAA